jgi:hypothetical protein
MVNVNNGTGQYDYDIGNGPQNSGNFYNLSQGNYTIFVSDSNCTSSIQTVLNGPDLIQGVFSNTDASCNEMSDGIISVIGSGGNGSYTYDFGSGFGASGIMNGLAAGNYSVLIQDNIGCISNISGSVNEPLIINTFTYVIDEVFGSDGEINITVSGGSPPYVFAWNGPSGYSSNNEDIGGLINGDYILTIIDNNGCISTESILVNSFVGQQNIHNDLLQVSPNPSKGIFKIDYEPMSNSSIQLNIFDLTGRLVFNKDFENQREIIVDISNKSKGIYLLKLLVDNEYLQKIIVFN